MFLSVTISFKNCPESGSYYLKEGTHGCVKKLNYIKTPKHIIQINNNMRHSLSTIQNKMRLYNFAVYSA